MYIYLSPESKELLQHHPDPKNILFHIKSNVSKLSVKNRMLYGPSVQSYILLPFQRFFFHLQHASFSPRDFLSAVYIHRHIVTRQICFCIQTPLNLLEVIVSLLVNNPKDISEICNAKQRGRNSQANIIQAYLWSIQQIWFE